MKTTDCPALRFIVLDDDIVKYRPTSGELTASSIKQFTQDVLDGKVKVNDFETYFFYYRVGIGVLPAAQRSRSVLPVTS